MIIATWRHIVLVFRVLFHMKEYGLYYFWPLINWAISICSAMDRISAKTKP